VPSDERADLEEKVANLEEATEQRMQSVAELYRKPKRCTSVPTDCLTGRRSTAGELSAVAPMTTTG